MPASTPTPPPSRRLLDAVHGPADVKALAPAQLPQLAQEIRDELIAVTAKTGGHIVPQPGEIEDAQWFTLDQLPNIPPRFSISGHLIRDTVLAMQAQGGSL